MHFQGQVIRRNLAAFPWVSQNTWTCETLFVNPVTMLKEASAHEEALILLQLTAPSKASQLPAMQVSPLEYPAQMNLQMLTYGCNFMSNTYLNITDNNKQSIHSHNTELVAPQIMIPPTFPLLFLHMTSAKYKNVWFFSVLFPPTSFLRNDFCHSDFFHCLWFLFILRFLFNFPLFLRSHRRKKYLF